MPVTTPCYCSRTDAQRAIDFTDGLLTNRAVDRAIQSASRNIEGQLHRLFYPWDGTKFFPWPNYQRAYPWRLWLDRNDILCLTTLSSGGIPIALNTCFLEPYNRKPGFPYTSIELDISTIAAFGGNAQTPQHAITVTATWGFTADADNVTTLAAAVATTGQNTIMVADSSQVSAGDLLILGYGRGTAPYPSDTLGHAGVIEPYQGERILVTDATFADTGVAFDGPATASSSDNVLAVPDGTQFTAGEVLQLDSEEMLILAIAQNNLILQRAWNGTVLAAHTGGEIYCARLLTVQRGELGTTASTYSEGAAVYKHRVPALVRDLAIADATNRILQETSGYARMVGGPDAAVPAPGVALANLWDAARTEYGRKARTRVI